MIKKLILCALSTMLFSASVKADEGMWMLSKIDAKTAKVMKDLGLQLTPQQLYDPNQAGSLKDAVVDFGDFCSGVVVSPDGLVFTNHHCGFSSIQSLSSTEHDYLKDGFVARSHAEELPAEGLYVNFLQRTDDVTARFGDAIRKNDKRAIDSIGRVIQKEYQEKDPSLMYRLQPFYGGNAYYISSYKVYKDVRLVFTPTQTLGKFGGDTDNWMWPRQTCDFSVFRIYADKDGNPADYSKDNVPFHPKRYAKVSVDGYQQGDYCMTIGYPGSTSRYLSSMGIQQRMVQQNEPRIEVRGLKQDVWTKWMRAERSIGIKYASKFASSSNYWKNSIGMNKALKDLKVIRDKRNLEKQVTKWYKKDAHLNERFSAMFPTLKKSYANMKDLTRTSTYFSETFNGIELTRFATAAMDLAYMNSPREEEVLREFLKDYDARVDEEAAAVLLENYAKRVDKKFHPDFIKTVKLQYKGNYKAYVHDLFSKSVVSAGTPGSANCTDAIVAAVKKLGKDIEKDPAYGFYTEVFQAQKVLRESMNQEYRNNISWNEQLLTQAILEMDMDQPHYSDANFSMRLSFGSIMDYTANGTHFDYYTNAQSLLKKVDEGKDNPDYEMEENIVSLLRKGDFGRYADKKSGDMQLCFLSNNDITGGNSGSPMFNGKGELIGLAFDGNWEAMSGDILFNPSMQRCIGVDIRFVLYLIDKWGHADNLIKELGL